MMYKNIHSMRYYIDSIAVFFQVTVFIWFLMYYILHRGMASVPHSCWMQYKLFRTTFMEQCYRPTTVSLCCHNFFAKPASIATADGCIKVFTQKYTQNLIVYHTRLILYVYEKHTWIIVQSLRYTPLISSRVDEVAAKIEVCAPVPKKLMFVHKPLNSKWKLGTHTL